MKYNYSRHLKGHKYLEAQLDLGFTEDWDHRPFNFSLSYTTKGDHHGLRFNVELLSVFRFDFQIYDNRHWNWDKDRHYEPGEEVEEKSAKLADFSKENLNKIQNGHAELSPAERDLMTTRISIKTEEPFFDLYNKPDNELVAAYKKIEQHYV